MEQRKEALVKFSRVADLPLLVVFAALGEETALDRYVKKPDASYRYDIVTTVRGDGYTTYVIDLTSQTWRKPSEVDRTVWKHWLTIVKPDRVAGTTGFLFITGGSTKDKAPEQINQSYVENALATHSVVAELQDVPNEPLVFPDEPRSRSEDGIIAYTWIKYMKTGDETWPLRLPMTKAAVRAMDTITAAMAAPAAGGVKVEKFVVSGGSKRGWTTRGDGAAAGVAYCLMTINHAATMGPCGPRPRPPAAGGGASGAGAGAGPRSGWNKYALCVFGSTAIVFAPANVATVATTVYLSGES